MDTLDLLAHPVRLRIVHATSGGQCLTTGQLCDRLADVPKTSVYRHVARLADAGVLEVVDQRRVRGAVERTYRLRRDAVVVDDKAAAALSPEEHRRVFAAAAAALIAEFGAYVGGDGADPAGDKVGYRQHTLWLDESEVDELIAGMRAAIAPKLANTPGPGRRPYLLSPIMFPQGQPPTP